MCFKTCSKCGFVWPERASFLIDPNLRLIGYQADFEELMAGIFLYSTTFAKRLSPLEQTTSKIYTTARCLLKGWKAVTSAGVTVCTKMIYAHIPRNVNVQYVREIVQVILNWPKQGLACSGNG